MGEVKLFRAWGSLFSWRVELALKLKGINYEIIDEDLSNKTLDLIKYNPVHKKVPVLVHDGKPIPESLIILEYIDEMWKENAIFPSDPFERAHARFWAAFIDDKIYLAAGKVAFGKGDDVEKSKQEYVELLKIFENEISGKKFLSGNQIGYLDIVGLLVCYWTPILEEAVGKPILTRDSFPGIYAWSDGLLALPFLKENLPNREKFVAFYRARFAPPS